MRKALTYLVFPLLCAFSLMAGAQVVPKDTVGFPRDRWKNMKGEFIRQTLKRDSILIGDQIEYGFKMEGIEDGTALGYLPFAETSMEITRDWEQRTVARRSQGDGKPDLIDVEASISMALFDEGPTKLPPIIVGRVFPSGQIDTVFFDPVVIDVKTIPVDTASFERHPMKGLVETPFNWDEFVYTVKEIWDAFIAILPWLLLAKWILVFVVVGFCKWMIAERKGAAQKAVVREPVHVVALRKLGELKDKEMWKPEKQKDFYTGVTDAIREYISGKYGISAMEMTSGELFNELKNLDELTPGQIAHIKDLFETADFVKFAKFVASDEDNASAVPKAERFVKETYQAEQENASEELEEKKK